jgi:hypothetical protein
MMVRTIAALIIAGCIVAALAQPATIIMFKGTAPVTSGSLPPLMRVPWIVGAYDAALERRGSHGIPPPATGEDLARLGIGRPDASQTP